MPKSIFACNGGAVTGKAAVIAASAVCAAAVVVMGASKLVRPQYNAFMTEDGITTGIITYAETMDDFIAEQREKLHPFDAITAVRRNAEGIFEIEVERAPHVTITDGVMTRNVRAVKGEKVAELMIREGFPVGDRDDVCPDLDLSILDDCEVTVTRAFPVTVRNGGNEKKYLAAGITVGDLLVREHIPLGAFDELNVSTGDIVVPGMVVEITKVTYAEHERSRYEPYVTEYRDSPLLAMGDTRVAVEGKDGCVTAAFRDKYVNGQYTGSEFVITDITEPVNEVIERGTAFAEPYSKREGNFTLIDGIPAEYEYVLEGKVTAYIADGEGTYSGRPLVIGSVGVDPDVIPFGSEVYIVSQDGSKVYGYAIASDTGDITDIIADAYMGTTSEHWDDAMNWCAQYCDVYVLTVGDNSVSWR